jgi:ribose transport system substrate-binding protein
LRKTKLANFAITPDSFFMRFFIRAGLALTVSLALVSLVVSLTIVRGLLQRVPDEETDKPPKYQFALYVPNTQSDSFSAIVAGAQRAAALAQAALTVHTYGENPATVRFGAWLGVDGIVVCPDPDADLRDPLAQIRGDKVPVVLINSNVIGDQPWPFVGTNNFDYGRKVANLVLEKTRAPARLAVVYSAKNQALYAERELFEMGIHATAGDRIQLVAPGLKSDLNPRQAEQLVRQLVKRAPGVTVVVFTDADDTLAGTQALVDLNLVGQIAVVGAGTDARILGYVKKGIVAGTLVVNPGLMGAQAVRALVDLKTVGYTSNSVDTGIDVVTADKGPK